MRERSKPLNLVTKCVLDNPEQDCWTSWKLTLWYQDHRLASNVGYFHVMQAQEVLKSGFS